MQTLLTTRFAPPALAATSQAKMSERAPQDRVMLPEIRAPEDERHARLLERMRARLPHAHHVPWGPSVAVGIPVALNVVEIGREGPAAWPVGRPLRVEDMEEVD